MIGSKRAGSNASSVLGVLADLKRTVTKDLALGVGAGASKERNWHAIQAAKDFEAARQQFDWEKYKAYLRRY